MRYPALLVLGILLFGGGILCAATPPEIESSIQRAVKYLYSRQKDGSWDHAVNLTIGDGKVDRGHAGGPTALATYALLAAGEDFRDPRLAQSIDILKKAQFKGVYPLAMRCQVWLLLIKKDPQAQALLRRDALALLNMTKTQGNARGMHDYTPTGNGGDYSHSRAQYATLGIWAAAQAGIEIPTNYWQTIEQAWIEHQDPSGGWTYKHPKDTNYPVTPGMTAAGLATLYLTQEMLHGNEGIDCRGTPNNPAIDRGMAWLVANFDKVATSTRHYPTDAGNRDFPYPTLFTVERVGLASGLKYFGNIDWYEKGSDWLVKVQRKDGAFATGGVAGDGMFAGVIDTCFGLLFLVRGRAPVTMNKLDYSAALPQRATASWNNRPRDLANFTRWTSRQLERDLNWQIVNLSAPLEDLHDAPILFISGSTAPNLTAEHEAKIKAYVESGGLVVASPDCNRGDFIAAMRKLGQKLFPMYEFRNLPDAHSIHSEQLFPRKAGKPPVVLGLSNGTRELMLIVPSLDLGRSWQLQQTRTQAGAFELGANIYLHSVDRQDLRYRGERHIVIADPKIKPKKTIKLARIKYPGNWDPEPGGWRRLAAILHNQHQVELAIETIELGSGKLDSTYHLAHMTGTTPITLAEAAAGEIKQYLNSGRTLLIDAAGGSSAFATSVVPELAKVVEGLKEPAVLEPAHALYAAGKPLPEVSYRRHHQKMTGQSGTTPLLRGVEVNGRVAVVLSREDLSAGLVGHAVSGINGYTPASAVEIAVQILEYAAP